MKYIIILCVIFSVTCCSAGDDKDKIQIRKAGVAGAFYPADAEELKSMVNGFLKNVKQPKIDGQIMAIIAPHAGYIYSGHVAAEAYAQIVNKDFERVIVISPSHTTGFNGVSVYQGDAYSTPLGNIEVDKEFCKQLVEKCRACKFSNEGHQANWQGRAEHALEVQLPFMQVALSQFKLVPLVMGSQDYQTCRELAYTLISLIANAKTLVVASSDLSHFHPYEEAVLKDNKVTNAIEEWDYFNLSRNLAGRTWEACGGGPIVTAMIASENMGAVETHLLKYANSGDVPAGDKSGVVGYAAFAIYKPAQTSINNQQKSFSLTKEEQAELLKIARQSVELAVNNNDRYDPGQVKSAKLEQDRGAFVTLKINGQLRGCIGYTAATQPLKLTICDAAVSAALKDPRFNPVKEEELEHLEYEISVLSPFRKVLDINQIEVGRHGLLIQNNSRSGLLLPQVPVEQGWDRAAFLAHTCLKAGLPADAWQDEDSDLFMYTAFVFGEH